MKEQITIYSETIPGDNNNYGWPARFDDTDGYIGISQNDQRVLLTPEQVEALIEFASKPSGTKQ